MPNKRTSYTSEFKFKIGVFALTETLTIAEISSQYGIHPTQISKWKKQLQEQWKTVFETKNAHQEENKKQQAKIENLYKQIGQLTVEVDWLKKKSGLLPI